MEYASVGTPGEHFVHCMRALLEHKNQMNVFESVIEDKLCTCGAACPTGSAISPFRKVVWIHKQSLGIRKRKVLKRPTLDADKNKNIPGAHLLVGSFSAKLEGLEVLAGVFPFRVNSQKCIKRVSARSNCSDLILSLRRDNILSFHSRHKIR